MPDSENPEGNRTVTPKPVHHLSQKTCRICETPLDVHQAARGQLCDRPGCRTQWASRIAMRRDRRHQRNDHLAKSLAFRTIENLMLENQIQRRANFLVATVPASQKPLRPANRKRQQSYREHFEQLLIAWQEQYSEMELAEELTEGETEAVEAVEAVVEEPVEQPEQEPLSALFGQACATCRGNCCTRGGTHAFQTLDTLERWFELHPEATVDDCRDAYFAHLKPNSIEGSCVFHGAGGCELPRDWRADMCNTWICHSLQQLRKNHVLHGKSITIIVATEPGVARRANVVRSDSGARVEQEVEIPS